jgi:hypothetical protein
MSKKIMVNALTLGSEIGLAILLTIKTSVSFVESAFFSGLFITICIFIFTSKGDLGAVGLDALAQAKLA